MRKPTKFLWLALALALVVLAIWQRAPLTDASARLHGLHARGILYSTRDLPLNGAEAANFQGTTIIKKLAVVDRQQVILTAVDGTNNRHAVHDPAFCFRGAGWQVASQEAVPLDHGEGRLLHLAQAGSANAEAIYWFSDGREHFSSPVKYWWKTALRRLTLGHSGEEPVLVILSSTSAAVPDWPTVLRAWPDLQTL